MTETTFKIRITPYLHIIPRTHLYELKTRKNATILNGNRYMFNNVVNQIKTLKNRQKQQQDLNDLYILLS